MKIVQRMRPFLDFLSDMSNNLFENLIGSENSRIDDHRIFGRLEGGDGPIPVLIVPDAHLPGQIFQIFG